MTPAEKADKEIEIIGWMVLNGYDRRASKDVAPIIVKYLDEVVKIISSNTVLADATRQKNLVKCGNCDEMVEMISSGEFCPCCFC